MLDFGSVPLTMPVKETPPSKLDDCCLLGSAKLPSKRPSGPGDLKDQASLFLKAGLPVGMGPDELMLEVTCGQNQAALYMSRLQLGSKGTCVLFENSWLTPNEFQYISGRETAKDWKRSIKHHGKSLKVLISKGILTTSPLRCNCGQCNTTTTTNTTAITTQSKDKDASKYVVTDDVKMTPASSLRDAYTTVVTKRVKPDCTKDTGERRFYGGAPGESNENRKDSGAPGESKTLLQQRTPAEQCLLTSHSLGGARYGPSCEYGKLEEMGLQLNGGYRLPIGCGQAGKKESCKYASSSSSSDDAKMRQKQSLEAKENAFSKDGTKLTQTVHQQKTGNECIKVNTMECFASGMTSQKRSTSSGGTKPGTSGPGGTWGQTSYHLDPSAEPTGTKPTHHDKTIKSTLSSSSSSSSSSTTQVNSNPSCVVDKPSCSQVIQNSGKIPASNNNGVPGSDNNPSRMSSSSSSSDPSYLFPSFGSPYYPMLPAPQLPAYYPNPYMWSMPFSANPSTCSYGWTAPSDMMCAPGCLRSPGKEPTLDCSGADQAFNFPWMKRSGYSSSAMDRDTAGGDTATAALSSTTSSSVKRKLDCDQSPSEYFPAAKHPLYVSPDNLRSSYGDTVAWPGYNPNAAALDFRFLPYNIPSYIPDIRPTHGLFASNFLKGSENHPTAASGFGLYPGLFPSPCLGVNSR